MTVTLYVAGPISGVEDKNRAAFAETKRRLEAGGFKVVLALDVEEHRDTTGWIWSDFVSEGIISMLGTDGVALMDGWANSTGAMTQMYLANLLGIPQASVDDWLAQAPILIAQVRQRPHSAPQAAQSGPTEVLVCPSCLATGENPCLSQSTGKPMKTQHEARVSLSL